MLPRTFSSPVQAFDGYAILLARFAAHGVSVVHCDLDDDADWDPTTRTMRLRRDASVAAHLRDLADLWWVAVFPDHRTRALPVRRHLRAVR